jgi:hypothetical protein
MDGIFENITFLIPIALLIVVRVISAKSKEDKKAQQKKTSEVNAEVRRIMEAQRKPSVTPQKTTPKKPAAVKKKAPVKEIDKFQSLIPDVNAAALGQIAALADAAAEGKTAIQKAAVPQPWEASVSLQELPPSQQAVVWAEILGSPKGFTS